MAKGKIPVQRPSYIMNLPVPPPPNTRNYLDSYRSFVYACITTIAAEVSAIEVKLYKKSGSTIKEVDEHEALSLLEFVNDFMTFSQLIDITQTYKELTGEAYWAKIRDNSGRVSELWALRPDWVKIVPSEDNFIKGYEYCPGGNNIDTVYFDAKDIVPFKSLNPEDAYRGFGVVKAIAQAVDINEFSADWIRQFFYNSALPGLIFTTDKKLKEAEIKRFMTEWKSKFQRRQNAHKVAFLSGGFKVDQVTQTPGDMQFLEQRKFVRDEILSAFRMPLAALGISEDVNRANAEATLRQFIERVIKPKMVQLVANLNEFYLSEWDDEELFFDFKDPTPADRDLDLKIYESGLTNGWLTTNEVRDMENLPPVEGGDVIYKPFTLQPLNAVGEKIAGFFGKKSDKADGFIRLEVQKDKQVRKFVAPIPHKRLRKIRDEAFKKGIKHDLKQLLVHYLKEEQDKEQKVKDISLSKEKKENYWKAMIVKTDIQEQQMIEMLKKLFKEQEKEVLNNLEYVKYMRKDYRKGKVDDFVFDMVSMLGRWKSIFEPFIKTIIIEKGADIFDFLGSRQNIDVSTARVVRFLETEGLSFIKSVNEVTIEKLKKTLTEGVILEESIPQLKNRVTDVFESATEARAKTIARTEVLRATNFASIEAYQQSGVVSAKEWLTALDERTCETCLPLDGVVVPLNKSFNTAVGQLDAPPAHPNCRCTTIPVIATKKVRPKNKSIIVEKVKRKIKEKEIEEKKKLDEIHNKVQQKIEVKEVKERADKQVEQIKEDANKQVEQVKEEAKKEKTKLTQALLDLRNKFREFIKNNG